MTTSTPTTPLYPVFLKLADVPVVVVGGGPVAASKLGGLLDAGARVTVIAPAISAAIVDRADALAAIHVRAFTPSDLDDARARWVVAAAATARGLFVNAVDDVASATAYLGGVIRRGEVEIAISTGGIAPALAGLLREALDAVLPAELEDWIRIAVAARAEHKAARVPIEARRPLLLRALDQLYAPHARKSP